MGAWVPMQAADPLNFGRTVFLRVWTDEFDFTYSPKGNIICFFTTWWPGLRLISLIPVATGWFACWSCLCIEIPVLKSALVLFVICACLVRCTCLITWTREKEASHKKHVTEEWKPYRSPTYQPILQLLCIHTMALVRTTTLVCVGHTCSQSVLLA